GTLASLDALLSDICIGSSAAPNYLSVLSFESHESDGLVRLSKVDRAEWAELISLAQPKAA
ncbi:hypothetical protein U1Q18_043018, partial [Sarracenia purpurea var. burkii]